MPDTNNGKYNIDDLVNSLLLERQSGFPAEIPQIDVVDESGTKENSAEEPVSLIGIEAVEEKSVCDEPVLVPDADDAVDVKVSEVTPAKVISAEKTQVIQVDEVASQDRGVPSPSVQPVAAATVVADTALEEMPKKRKKLFGRKLEDTATIERSWADWGLKPIGHYRSGEALQTQEAMEKVSLTPVEATLPKEASEQSVPKKTTHVDEFPAVAAVAETITMQVVLPSGVALPRGEAHTRIIPNDNVEATVPVVPPVASVAVEMDEQLPDQLSLEEMVRVEDIAPTESDIVVEDDVDPEERLQRAREEKVREFTLGGGEEEENEPCEEPAVVDEEEEIEDYTGYQDTETVASELKYRCRTSLFSALFTGLIQVVLLFLTLLTINLDQPPIPTNGYLLVHLFGLCIMMVLNFSTISRGLSGLFTLRANNDTAPALASVVGLVDIIMHFVNTNATPPYWTPLVGLLLVLSAAGHYTHEARVRRNFAFVSHPSDKYAATVIEDENALQEIGRRAVSDGEATVAYFRRTGFLSDYLTNAYDDDCGDDWSRWMTPAALGLSLALSFLSLMSENVSGVMNWMSVFTGMVCLSMPITALAVQMPLSRCCRRMLSTGGFLSGWKAVRRFGRPDALAVDIADLYPDESMCLHGIKTFSGTHIDEAILTAASLAVRSGGPLAMIFRRIIENKEELLYEVDSLVYEQGMGLSGWVEGRRVFVGNRRLLLNHGVDVPSTDFEARYAKDGRRLVYISIAGQLSAMFVVSYLPDPEIQAALQELCRARVTLLVRSCDPNITTSDLCESFELDEYYVDVLPASAGRMYVQLTEQTTETLPALMASNGHILGTARVLSACRSLQVKARIALVIQMIIALLGLIFCLVWTMQNTLSLFQPLLLMLISLFLTWLVPMFRR